MSFRVAASGACPYVITTCFSSPVVSTTAGFDGPVVRRSNVLGTAVLITVLCPPLVSVMAAFFSLITTLSSREAVSVITALGMWVAAGHSRPDLVDVTALLLVVGSVVELGLGLLAAVFMVIFPFIRGAVGAPLRRGWVGGVG